MQKTPWRRTFPQKPPEYHYGKHHGAYVTNLNNLIRRHCASKASPSGEIVRTSEGGVFNNAAQVWNHTFYWNCPGGLTPAANRKANWRPQSPNLSAASLDFKAKFTDAAAKNFGAGWTCNWSKMPTARLAIVSTSNAGTPVTTDAKPLLTVDVWEHAYYIDYRNARQATRPLLGAG